MTLPEELELNDKPIKSDKDGYFKLIISDLKPSKVYRLQFRWQYQDGSFGPWSLTKLLITPSFENLVEPSDPVFEGIPGAIKCTWDGKDSAGNLMTSRADFDRVDIHIAGTSFGNGLKPTDNFKLSGTKIFKCEPGIYLGQLKGYRKDGTSSFFSNTISVTVPPQEEEAQPPVTPKGFSSERVLSGIEVAWNGTYTGDAQWYGFQAINVYAGTSSSATSGTYIKVGQMTANKTGNKIVAPVDGTYIRYDQPVYFHASSLNTKGQESSIVSNVTSQTTGARSAISSDLAANIITNEKLVNDAVSAAKIATAAITEVKIDNNAITAAKIAAGAVTETKIANDAISAPKIVAGAIEAGKIAAGAITAEKISANAIEADKIAANAITSAKIVAGAITADKIVSSAITSDKIATNAITATKIEAGSIDVVKLAAGTISVNNLEAGNIKSTSYVRAGTDGSARVEISSATVGTVLPGLTIYGTNGTTQVLRAGLDGNLAITGHLTATQISTASTKFKVDSNGIMDAKDATFTGTITANGGDIGGIKIMSNALQNNTIDSAATFKLDSSGKARFGGSSGNSIIINPAANVANSFIFHSIDGGNTSSNKFRVETDGTLYAVGANLSGTITAQDGDIGGWLIDSTKLTGGATTLNNNGNIVITSGTKTTTIGNNAIISLVDTSTGFLSGGALSIQSGSEYSQFSARGMGVGGSIFIGNDGSNNIYIQGGATTGIRLSPNAGLGSTTYNVQVEGHLNSIYSLSTGQYTSDETSTTDGTHISAGRIVARRITTPLFLHRTDGGVGPLRATTFYSGGVFAGGINMFTNQAAQFVNPSDYRLKENIQDYNNASEIVKKARLRKFNFKNDPDTDVVGFIAHEYAEVNPNFVIGEKDAVDENGDPIYQEMMMGSITPYLIGALKESILKIEQLEARLDALEG